MIYPKPRSDETLKLIREALVYDERYEQPLRFTNTFVQPAFGKNTDGYIFIKFPEGNILVSHIVWFLNTNEWPTLQVDHKDHNKTNNKFKNLQQLTHAANNGRRRHSWSRGDYHA